VTKSTYQIQWRPKAEEDLLNIIEYISKDNPSRAKSFVEELEDKAQLLADYPELGRRSRPGLPKWLRELVVHPNYIIFYRVLYDSFTVEIIRVKHAAQAIP
jgi:addiction module RelE/StbE family toxin